MTTNATKLAGSVAGSDKYQILCKPSCSDSVTATHDYETLPLTRDNCFPQGICVVRGLVSEKFSVRVLARLAEAEQKTEVAIEQQDYRIAWLTVLRADEGNPEPWRTAFWEIVGNTPEKAIPFWLCRDDLLRDEYVPLGMLELRYTREWGSDYVRAKMAAEAARAAGLPPKKPVEFAPLPFPEKRKKNEQGFSSWLPIAFCTFFVIALTLWLVRGTRHTYFYQYPDNYLRVVRNVDPCLPDGSCGYRFAMQAVTNGVAGNVTEMQFCKGLQPRFEAGHTLRWIRYANLGSCQSIDGYDIVRDASGQPELAPNCVKDYTTAPVAGHIACDGGMAKFQQ